MRVAPGASGGGVVFRRCDLAGTPTVAARVEHVVATERRTALEAGGARVETIEHLLAATRALGIDDLAIDLDGPEVPILDGSFAPFVALLDAAGVREQPGVAARMTVRREVTVREGDAEYLVAPAEELSVEVTLVFAAPVIGTQTAACTVTAESFRGELARARTFGFLAEVEALQRRGLLAGASSGCAILLSEAAVLNTTLQWPNEYARHKAGDLIGDLALLGAPLALKVTSRSPSHRGNVACARAIAGLARYLEAT